MKIEDIATETYGALTVNKVRSSLTVLGIVIGIGSVISMISIGQGAQDSISSSIEGIGSNLLMVRPGAGGHGPVSSGQGTAQSLDLDDAEAIKGLELAASVAPEKSGRFQMIAGINNTSANVVGTTPEYATVRNIEIEYGIFLTEQYDRQRSKVIVLGATLAEDLFDDPSIAVGQKIKVNNGKYTVIGVTVSKGGGGFGSTDDQAYVPLSTAQQFLVGGDNLNMINVMAVDQESMTQLQEDITEMMLIQHNIGNPDLADFSVINQADIVATIGSVAETFTLLLGAVAAISLVVGGIGIMNMMLTTVTERTKEIGLRKAIGAKASDIRIQFLLEAVMLTLIGGVLGIALAWGVAELVTKAFGVAATITLEPVLLAFGVSTAIGIIFGFYPAYQASKLSPMEALRYE